MNDIRGLRRSLSTIVVSDAGVTFFSAAMALFESVAFCMDSSDVRHCGIRRPRTTRLR
jgi:hypothetical protein